jgi:hypothetical protein
LEASLSNGRSPSIDRPERKESFPSVIQIIRVHLQSLLSYDMSILTRLSAVIALSMAATHSLASLAVLVLSSTRSPLYLGTIKKPKDDKLGCSAIEISLRGIGCGKEL